jgi:hypothetical protein
MREGEEEGGRRETVTTWQVIGTEDEAADVGMHSGIRNHSLVPEHSCTGLGPLISVPDWFRHRHEWMSDSPIFRHFKMAFKGWNEPRMPAGRCK